MVEKHREKSAGYGREEDSLWNFGFAADIAGTTAMRQCISLIGKHLAAMTNWLQSEERVTHDPAPTEFSDDLMVDLPVYFVILHCLYQREGH